MYPQSRTIIRRAQKQGSIVEDRKPGDGWLCLVPSGVIQAFQGSAVSLSFVELQPQQTSCVAHLYIYEVAWWTFLGVYGTNPAQKDDIVDKRVGEGLEYG